MNTSSEKPIHKIQATIFRSQMFLIVILTVLVTIMGLGLNLYYESRRLDENLQNVAETIASSQIIQNEVRDSNYSVNNSVMKNYLDSLKKSLSNIDVISVVRHDGIRRYHSSPDLIGTVYDGTIPEFIQGQREFYASDDKGPSGFQRRAYAAIYGDDGEYIGFVMAVMLRQNILKNNIQMVFLYLCAAGIAIGFAVLTSVQLSGRIKQQLMGYEPDAFTAMFKIRDDILGSLEEGVLAIDSEGRVMFLNEAASQMLHLDSQESAGKLLSEVYPDTSLNRILHTGEKEFNVRLKSRKDEDILSNRIPLIEDGQTVGAVSIFRNRTEYTKLMEDLTGVRYMVESMRANNHDFTNKLHVILGLIQMGNYEEAEKYIGIPYVYGGTTPDGFDCSGFVKYVFEKFDIKLKRVSRDQYAYCGTEVARRDLQPGDLVFFGSGGVVGHVGIYTGDGEMIHSPSTGKTLCYTSIETNYYKSHYIKFRNKFYQTYSVYKIVPVVNYIVLHT